MPFVDSPGWERDWQEHPWTWDFEVSTVSEGHRVVGDTDKTEAKNQGAKLTFGEVLDCGVSRMLYNLGAPYKRKFHDLGMGPGKMLIQTYLQYFNLNCCMGVELARGRYELAENNVRTLLKVGWRGRKFLGIEFKKGQYMKIVELTKNQTPKNGWKIGDKVIAFHPFVRNKKEDIPNYDATIIDIIDNKKGLFKIEYNNKELYKNDLLNKSLERGIQLKYLFKPDSVRTLEIWYGSLFDYPNGFDAEICVLETDFPDEMHPELVRCMSRQTPIGCTFLTYHNLKKFDCYDWDNLRQIDNNVFDNDRYITSWSQGWRFYTWQHCRNQKTSKPYSIPIAKDEFTKRNLNIGESIIFHTKNESNSKVFGVIEKIEFENGNVLDRQSENLEEKESNDEIKYLTIKTLNLKNDGSGKDSIKEGILIINKDEVINGEYILFKTSFRHYVGKRVCAHDLDLIRSNSNASNKYDTVYARVVACDCESLTYCIEYESPQGPNKRKFDANMPETCVFDPPQLKFEIGQRVMACWPRNAQNKNCIHRYKRFPGQIIGINNDATYRVRFETNAYLMSLLRAESYPMDYNEETKQNLNDAAPTIGRDIATCVREMWIDEPASFVVKELTQLEQKIGIPFYSDLSYDDCKNWNNQTVIRWFDSLGLFKNGNEFENLIKKSKMDGKQLFSLCELAANSIKSNVKTKKNENDNDGSDEKVFSQTSLNEYLKQIYNENGKESDEKSEENMNQFDNFTLPKLDFKNLMFNLKHIFNDLNQTEAVKNEMEHQNKLRAAAAASGINIENLANFAEQLRQNGGSGSGSQSGARANASSDPAIDITSFFKNFQHLQNTYPSAFNNDQDSDRKED